MKVVLHPAALQELRRACEWYGANSARLVALVDAKLGEIAANPESFPRDSKRSWARRARILNWPYTLIFVVDEAAGVVVLAVAHGRRRTGYWARRRSRTHG